MNKPAEGSPPTGMMGQSMRPQGPREKSLENEELAAALLGGQLEFTQEQWEVFGIKRLRLGHFIKAGDTYFKPTEASMHENLAMAIDEKTKHFRVSQDDPEAVEKLDTAQQKAKRQVRFNATQLQELRATPALMDFMVPGVGNNPALEVTSLKPAHLVHDLWVAMDTLEHIVNDVLD